MFNFWRVNDITTDDSFHYQDSLRLCKSKKRILVVGPLPPTVGGITSFIKGFLDSDLKKKYSLIAFGTERPTVGIPKDVSDYTVMFQVGFFPLIKSVVWTTSHILSFPFALLKNRPDIVHVHTSSYWSFWENAIYVLVSRMLSKKLVFHIHGGRFKEFCENSNSLVKFLISKILNLPNKVIALSSTWKGFLANLMPENKIIVLENFANLSHFRRFKSKDNLSEDMIKVLFVGGAAAKEKGLYDVIKAISIVIKQCKNILFLFVACSGMKELDTICEKKEVDSHARFLSYLQGDEKLQIFFETDIFILPSYSEGLPITMLEAMAAGLPVIATSVGAIPEVIEDGKNGFLIKAGDSHALAEKILMLAKDEKLRKRIGKNNIEKIKRQYDREVVIEKLDSEYEKLLLGD